MSQQTAAALSDRSVLGDYRGRDIIRTSLTIRNTGDGLSEAMGIDPQVLEIGDEVYVLLKCEVVDHAHPIIKDTDCLELKQVLKAGTATIVDADYAEDRIDQQAARIQRAKDAASGQGSINTELLERQHMDGSHADGLVEGCPRCDDERDAEEAEKAEG